MTPFRRVCSLTTFFYFLLLTVLATNKKINICPRTNEKAGEFKMKRHCCTLEEYFLLNITSDTTLILEDGHHQILSPIHKSNLFNIVIKGENIDTTIINCSKSAALSFRNSSNIRLENVHITECGCNSTDAALSFYYGRNVSLVNVTISDSFKSAFKAENVKKILLLRNCNIKDIEPENATHTGNVVTFSDCDHKQSHFIIAKSVFSNRRYSNYTFSTSGLTINANCETVVNITDSEFTNNADWKEPGGNLRLVMENITNLVPKFYLQCVNISNGHASKGGGLFMKMAYNQSYYDSDSSTMTANNTAIVHLENLLIKNNTSDYTGGGVYITQEVYEKASVNQNITFSNCNFTQNRIIKSQSSGVAIHSNSFIHPQFLAQKMPLHTLNFSHCHFYCNGRPNTTANGSVILINSNKNTFIGSINVTYNSMNAITAVNSNLILSGRSFLTHNNGSSGGGLLLCENGILFFENNSHLEINHNHVLHAGGGICVEPQCLEAHPRCFFQIYQPYDSIDSLNISITVKDNKARYAGHNIYGGDIDHCYLLDMSKPTPEKHKHNNFSHMLFWKIFEYDHICSSLTSPPRKVALCNKNNSDIIIYPGMNFTISAKLEGQLKGIVPGVVVVKVNDKNATLVHLNNNAFRTNSFNSNICYCYNQSFTINGTSPSKFQLTLIPEHSGDNSGFEKMYGNGMQSFSVTIKSCPNGSKFNSGSHQCDSIIPNTVLKINGSCNFSSCNPLVMFEICDKFAWFEIVNDTVHYFKYCPFDYCDIQQQVYNSTDSSRCQYYRTNTLCGACKDDFSAMLGTSKCEICTNRNVLMLLLFALVGLALVIFLTVTNLTVAEGTLSGLLFYANVLESNTLSLLPLQCTHSPKFCKLLKVFIGWLNLDLAIPMCLFDGMTPYQKAWLDFVFPIYIWVLSILIIRLCSRYQWIAKLASKNATKVLATLVLLSYTRFLHSIIFNFSRIRYDIINVDGTNMTSKPRWLVDPTIHYLHGKHLLIFIFSLFFALMCLPFMFVLVFIRRLPQYSQFKLFHWILRLKPFLDAFTGPYTDHGRIWPGLLLIARAGISIAAGLNSLNDPLIKVGITMVVIMCLLVVAASTRPGLYSNQWLDWLEYFFLLNLCAMCLGKGYSALKNVRAKEVVFEIVFQVSAGSSLIAFSGIVTYHIWLSLRRLRFSLVITGWIVKKYSDIKKIVKNDQWFKKMDNYPPPTADIPHEREPLIAEHEE